MNGKRHGFKFMGKAMLSHVYSWFPAAVSGPNPGVTLGIWIGQWWMSPYCLVVKVTTHVLKCCLPNWLAQYYGIPLCDIILTPIQSIDCLILLAEYVSSLLYLSQICLYWKMCTKRAYSNVVLAS
jgi:hypothetical protein